MILVQANQANPVLRQVYFQLVGTDGITPALNEAGGQPQISSNGGAWTGTGISTLTAIGNGRYYATLTQAAVATAGTEIETRYASGSTAECPGDSVLVVNYNPDDCGCGGGGGGGGAGTCTSGKTVISGTSGYCVPQDILNRFDYRNVGDLITDDSTATRPTQAQVLASPILADFILEASGKVEAACLAGNRYTVADLQALQSPVMTNGGKMLASLVANLAMWLVWQRRPRKEETIPVNVQEVRDTLAALGKGETIFGFQQTADAGHLEHHLIRDEDVWRRNDRTVIAERYFGRRADRDPNNPPL